MSGLKRAILPLIILTLVAVAGFVMLTGGDDKKTLTAFFPRAISVYEGSDVRVLGVPVGTIDEVTPEGTRVKVSITYDSEVKVPSNAEAVIISPSVVGDRYVQLTPAYESGDDEIADAAVLEEEETSEPLELDEIYESIDELTVALGPTGANREGALTDLLERTAENFGGQGEQFNQTIQDFSRLSQTLDNNKEELFGSAAELQKFISTLADNDQTVRDFNDSLGQVSTLLSGERQELSDALRNLGDALSVVGTFVEENRESLGRNIKGINRVAKVLVKQRGALDETLRTAPLALNNLYLTYNPDAGTLDTNANIGNLEQELINDPEEVLCALVSANDPDNEICPLIRGEGNGRSQPFRQGEAGGTTNDDEFDPTLGGLVGVKS